MSKKCLISLTLVTATTLGCANSDKPMYTMAECKATAAAKAAAEKKAVTPALESKTTSEVASH